MNSLAPPELPGDLKRPNRVVINVGGVRFETFRSTLSNVPDTRLSWITRSKSENPDFDSALGEYFFDRDPNMFHMILNYYRTGKLHTPADVCGPAFETELSFWGIDEKQIESCCWSSYSKHRDAQRTLEELNSETSAHDEDSAPGDNIAEKFGIAENSQTELSSLEKWRPKVWAVLNHQSSSRLAKMYVAISSILTLMSIVAFVLESDQNCREYRQETNKSRVEFTLKEWRNQTKPHPALLYIEMAAMSISALELLARFVCCPFKCSFFKGAMNWIDLITISSFYLSLAFEYNNINDISIDVTMQLIRSFGVIRVFKITSQLTGLKIIIRTIKASASELLLMLAVIFSLATVFASFIYLVELSEEIPIANRFITSIPHGLWWAIVTMTTVGYGDFVPKTILGYIVGILCAITGIMFIALPIPIIVNNFTMYYTHAQAQASLPKKKNNILVGAANALKQDTIDDEDIDGEQGPATDAAKNYTQNGSVAEPNYVPPKTFTTENTKVSSDTTSSGLRKPGITVTYTDDTGDETTTAAVTPKYVEVVPINSIHDSSSTLGNRHQFKNGSDRPQPNGLTDMNRRGSIAGKRADPRERRRSIAPSGIYYNN